MMLLLLLPAVFALAAAAAPEAAAAAACNVTVDAATGKGFQQGQLRGGAYYKAVTAGPAAATAAGCAALCCQTDGCLAFSLNAPWSLAGTGAGGGCVHGKNCCSLANSLGPMLNNTYPMNITTGVVKGPPSDGKPPGANRSFDCAVRKLAYEYAKSLRPDKGEFSVVHDALQLLRCGAALSGGGGGGATGAPPARGPPPPPGSVEYFVSTTDGSDGAAGSLAAPFATPQRGVTACRAASGGPCTVTLRGGTYYLGDSPVQLTAADDGLTLRSYAGERAELSGGEPLTGLSWSPATTTGRNGTAAVWAAPFRSVGELAALRLRSTGRRLNRARFPNGDPETAGARRSGDVNEGWMPAAAADWYPAAAGPTPGQDFVSNGADWPGVDWSHHMQMAGGNFTIGYGGGRCDDMASGVGYWCGLHCPRGDNYIHTGPGGLRNPAAVLPHFPYSRPQGMVVHMWAGGAGIGPWFTLQWQVGGVGASGALDFAPGGGTQGSEGDEDFGIRTTPRCPPPAARRLFAESPGRRLAR